MHHVMQGGRHARYYFPTGVIRGQGNRLRVDYFDSIKHVSVAYL
ncbi:unnamed protein product [Ectocarpus fasciculatus]